MSITHGTCALNGKHTDPAMAQQCPVLRAQRRAEEGGRYHPTGYPSGAHEDARSDEDLEIGFPITPQSLEAAQQRLRKPGRPSVSDARRQERRREAQRAYREREKGAPA